MVDASHETRSPQTEKFDSYSTIIDEDAIIHSDGESEGAHAHAHAHAKQLRLDTMGDRSAPESLMLEQV